MPDLVSGLPTRARTRPQAPLTAAIVTAAITALGVLATPAVASAAPSAPRLAVTTQQAVGDQPAADTPTSAAAHARLHHARSAAQRARARKAKAAAKARMAKARAAKARAAKARAARLAAADAVPTALLSPLARLRGCESGGRYDISTGNGYYGAYQFSRSTWQGLGMPGTPDHASARDQDAAAVRLHARSGWSPWPACSRSLGLS